MKRQAIMLVCAGVVTSNAWADSASQKTDLGVTVVDKNGPQVLFDTSTAEGKGDLVISTKTELFIRPASNQPFEMAPDRAAVTTVAECDVSPLTVGDVRKLVIKAAEDEDFDARLALAVAEQESGFNPNALSEKGAVGPMQLMPATASDLKVNRCDPAENARGGVRYLKSLTAQFGNPVFALAAYNAGPENVARHKGIPPFTETVHYVARVLTKYYGAPKRTADNAQITSAAPAKKAKPSTDAVKIVPASDTPEASVWASGFVMHLN